MNCSASTTCVYFMSVSIHIYPFGIVVINILHTDLIKFTLTARSYGNSSKSSVKKTTSISAERF